MQYSQMSNPELAAEFNELKKQYEELKAQNLKLDMSRGKPAGEQLDLTMNMLKEVIGVCDCKSESGLDCRNYGVLDGIPECKRLFAEMLEVDSDNIILGGTSSLTLMFDYITQCMLTGAGDKPWSQQGDIKFICNVPGYDRHFGICEYYGIKMINVPMLSDGPDVEKIAELVKDRSVKGMFCVPKYSNPTGVTYSDEKVRALAALKPAAKDFRVIWDNAYIVHDFLENPDKVLNIFEACKEFGTEDYFIEFTSTSKISFPGAGVSCLAASDKNIQMIKKRFNTQMIGHDKLNQLRHAKYFKNLDGIKAHMKKHAAILKPKFDAVTDGFAEAFDGTGIASWRKPNGGYFVSLFVMKGCAKRVGQLCKDAGLTLTTVGATYPYGVDPDDSNIRIAPSYPDVDELRKAVELLCICVKLAAVEKLIEG